MDVAIQSCYFFNVMFSLWVSIFFYLKVFMYTLKCLFTPHIIMCKVYTYLYSLRVPKLQGVKKTLHMRCIETPIFNSDNGGHLIWA